VENGLLLRTCDQNPKEFTKEATVAAQESGNTGDVAENDQTTEREDPDVDFVMSRANCPKARAVEAVKTTAIAILPTLV